MKRQSSVFCFFSCESNFFWPSPKWNGALGGPSAPSPTRHLGSSAADICQPASAGPLVPGLHSSASRVMACTDTAGCMLLLLLFAVVAPSSPSRSIQASPGHHLSPPMQLPFPALSLINVDCI